MKNPIKADILVTFRIRAKAENAQSLRTLILELRKYGFDEDGWKGFTPTGDISYKKPKLIKVERESQTP